MSRRPYLRIDDLDGRWRCWGYAVAWGPVGVRAQGGARGVAVGIDDIKLIREN